MLFAWVKRISSRGDVIIHYRLDIHLPDPAIIFLVTGTPCVNLMFLLLCAHGLYCSNFGAFKAVEGVLAQPRAAGGGVVISCIAVVI